MYGLLKRLTGERYTAGRIIDRVVYGASRVAGAPSLPTLRNRNPYFHRLAPQSNEFPMVGKCEVHSTEAFALFVKVFAAFCAPTHQAYAQALDEGRQDVGVLSFDDGYIDNFTLAAPILDAAGCQATFFIVTDFIGQQGAMTWDHVRQLHAAGHTIGSHTKTHRPIPTLTPVQLHHELEASKKRIEDELSAPCYSISYPYGLYTPQAVDVAKQLGYRYGFTTVESHNTKTSDRLQWSRTKISPFDATTTDMLIRIGGHHEWRNWLR